MPRLLGVDIPNEKRIEIALTYIYGVGSTTACKVLKELAMMRVQSELASKILAGIQDYARSKRRALISAMT